MKRIVLALACLLSVTAGCGDNLVPESAGEPDSTVGEPDAILVPSDSTVAIDAAAPDAAVPVDSAITVACTVEDLTPLFTCAQTSCASDPTLTCVLGHCGLLLFALPPTCRQCVLAGAGGDLATTIGACVSGLPGN